jgi:hypothetical protein
LRHEVHQRLPWVRTASGNQLDVVEALAGTGKTTTTQVIRRIYEDYGYQVVGAAPTGRAERELTERTGIARAHTLDWWSPKLQANPGLFEFWDLSVTGDPLTVIQQEAPMRQRLSHASNQEQSLSGFVEPKWITQRIGELPTDKELIPMWEQAAGQLDSYRANAGITDPDRTSLGRIPPGLVRVLLDARKALLVSERGRQLDNGLEL